MPALALPAAVVGLVAPGALLVRRRPAQLHMYRQSPTISSSTALTDAWFSLDKINMVELRPAIVSNKMWSTARVSSRSASGSSWATRTMISRRSSGDVIP